MFKAEIWCPSEALAGEFPDMLRQFASQILQDMARSAIRLRHSGSHGVEFSATTSALWLRAEALQCIGTELHTKARCRT